MRELRRPPEIEGDDNATEMIRVWVAHDDLHVSLVLGMWEDADESEVDECRAWGYLLADLTRHIANGLQQSHGWRQRSTIDWIRQAFLENLADGKRSVEGGYPEGE